MVRSSQASEEVKRPLIKGGLQKLCSFLCVKIYVFLYSIYSACIYTCINTYCIYDIYLLIFSVKKLKLIILSMNQ